MARTEHFKEHADMQVWCHGSTLLTREYPEYVKEFWVDDNSTPPKVSEICEYFLDRFNDVLVLSDDDAFFRDPAELLELVERFRAEKDIQVVGMASAYRLFTTHDGKYKPKEFIRQTQKPWGGSGTHLYKREFLEKAHDTYWDLYKKLVWVYDSPLYMKADSLGFGVYEICYPKYVHTRSYGKDKVSPAFTIEDFNKFVGMMLKDSEHLLEHAKGLGPKYHRDMEKLITQEIRSMINRVNKAYSKDKTQKIITATAKEILDNGTSSSYR